MADDLLSQTLEQSSPQSTALLPSEGAEPYSGEWNGVPALAQPAAPTGPELSVFLHAFRRHWLLALGIGLVCAVIAGPVVWFSIGTVYTASAVLRVDMQEKTLLGGVSGEDREKFEIFKATQKESLLGRLVLLAALRKPEVFKIPEVQEQQQIGDPADWLQKLVSVTFPGRAEIMDVSVARRDKHEAAVLVNAVVDSYITEVVNAEHEKKRQQYGKLETAHAEKDQQIRNKRQELKNLALSYGTSAEPEMIAQKQKLLTDELSLYRQELARRQFEAGKLECDLVAQQALQKNVDTAPVPAEEADLAVNADPVARQVSLELGLKKQDQMYNDTATSPNSKNKYAVRYGRELEMLQKQYDGRLHELKEKIRERKHSVIAAEIIRLQTLLEITTKQQNEMAATVEKMTKVAQDFGGSTVDIEMLRSELRQSEMVLSELNEKLENARVELQSAPRVTLWAQAEDPVTPSNRMSRLALTLMVMMGTLCLPAVALTLLDVRTRRINTPDDVSKGLQLSVIGSVPLIPSRVIRRLGSPSKRYQSWHVRLTESVDGITARVLHKAEMGQCRVIMVASATGGEGKTTLATQLAMSLARAGRSVVLVDFDLRRPAFNEVFGLPLEPGVSELLRRQSTVSEIAHPSGTDNLAVITAGRWDRQALASLSNGSAAAMFDELRKAYDFVVIDSSPLLPVADARFVSQHVDSVVLSVFRDVSEAPKIQAACDILAAFGVQSVDAVVTGVGGHVYGRHNQYESTIPA
jgi:capsular exopolysaccharide synthesis family protein